MYGCSLYKVIGFDLRDNRPEVPRTFGKRIQRRQRQLHNLMAWVSGRSKTEETYSDTSDHRSAIAMQKLDDPERTAGQPTADPAGDILAQRPFDSHFQASEEILPVLSRNASKTSVDAKVKDNLKTEQAPIPEPAHVPLQSVRSVIVKRIQAFASPPTVAVLISLIFALVPPLKALIVPVEGWSGTKLANAPDGGAPLAFLYDVSCRSTVIGNPS